jgi:cellulose synthase/poly-beta-1,6-N-acetylglucosamine synthase-like glycosyltransferase
MIGIWSVLVLVTSLLFGIPVLIFVFYGLVLLYYGRHREEEATEKGACYDEGTYEPMVSVVIPTHNEQNVIAKRMENLLACDYPKDKLEIIFVDDSDDLTPSVIQRYMNSHPQIHLIRFNERQGYSPCLVAGCRAAHGEVIVLAEASSTMDAKAIRVLVNNFRTPGIGVVTGKDVILNPDEEGGRSEQLYLRVLDYVRRAESRMDSTIYMKGEAAAVRKDLIKDLSSLDRCHGTADTGLILLVRKKGFRAIYDPRVLFFEYAPSTHSERVRQKANRGAVLIRILWTFRSMFLRPKYGKFGMITLPISFAMLAFAPISLLAGMLLFLTLTVANPAAYFPIWTIGGFLLLVAFLTCRSAVFTILESEYALVKGLCEVLLLRKSHDKIEKVASTRRLSS